ncbi:MAG: serine hydrolase [Elusimicrobia bacterium]|nr:serine hydrolase [Elusimicrobiota bacterium]
MTTWIGAAVFLAALWRLCLSRYAAVGCSYKAKALASGIFVSGLDLEPNSAPDVSDDAYKIMRLFHARVDRDKKTVTASFFGLQPRVAAWRPGFGAALTPGPLPAAPAPAIKRRSAELPLAEVPALSPILDAAFTEPGPTPRRTRAVLILKNGVIAGERYAPGFSAETPLNGWSMTKSVMGSLIGILAKAGTLNLADKNLLPEWADDGRRDIALEDLLRMRSGLRFSEVYSSPFSDVTRMLYNDGYDAGGFAASRPLEAPPGTKWQYSSGTTNILSLIARRKLGEAQYPSWPRRALFDPLGMDSAVFETDAAGTFVGSSYLFATARDWARFGAMAAAPGVWNTFSTTPTPQAPDGKYGAHWWLKLPKELGGETPAAAKIPADAFHALGHEGQCLTVIPSRGLVIVHLGLSIDIKAWDHAAFLAGILDAIPA